MNYKDLINIAIPNKYKSIDLTMNGTCRKCGECCSSLLPIDQEDVDMICEYVVTHNIFPQRHILVMQNKLQCPYYTGNKEKGCSIYEARPKICRFFKCDKKTASLSEVKALKAAVPVDMWSLAEDIEKEMKKSETNKKTRKAIK